MLVHNWREVLKRAWSIRLMALALIFIVLEPVINFVAGTWIPRNVYIQLAMSIMTGLLTAAAIVARLVFQQQISGELNGKPPSEG